MEDKIIELFKKYSKSVDTEYNVYNCLIEEDWSNISQEIVKLFLQSAVISSFCECKVCGKPFGDKLSLYEHYDEEHNKTKKA